MIQFYAIGFVLSKFLLALAGTMLVPLGFGWATGSAGLLPLGIGFVTTALTGAVALLFCPRPTRELNKCEGILLVVAIWMSAGLFGCIPFYLSPHFNSFTDALFESVSGFTTTGATILTEVEVLPASLQLWRCFTQWLGGMGIVLLGIAVLPLVGHGGMHLYRAEFSGAKSERLRPRITETVFALWKIYLSLSIVEFLALRLAGMNGFEALCTTFTTVSTGGFSTRSGSIGAFNSPLIEFIVITFMIFGGISFVLHYRLWVERSPRQFFADFELRYFLTLLVMGTVIVAGSLLWNDDYITSEAIRGALFQVTSIATGTGYVTGNYELWHPLAQLLLLALMFHGGCTGSTTGGMKASRVLLMGKIVDREFKRMVEPRGVFSVRMGGSVVPEGTIQSLLSLVYLAFAVNFLSCILLAAMGVDVLTAISAVVASMFNVGPSLGTVGPSESYAHLPSLAKWILMGNMIAGRLEFYTLLVILTPAFWRK